MSELFIVNLDSDLDGVYLSDLPAVNATPVARQIGFYLGTALTATSSQVAQLATYISTGTLATTVGGTVASGTLTADDGLAPTHMVSVAGGGTSIFVQGDLDAGDAVTMDAVIAKIIATYALDLANGNHSAALTLATLNTEVDAVIDAAKAGAAFEVDGDTLPAGASACDIGAGGATAEGIMRILMGAEPSAAATFSEGAILGNHRLIGGLRRIYSRDRIDACIHEGSLSLYKSATDFEGTAKAVQCLILNESGVKQ